MRFNKFGAGLNPGKKLHAWLMNIFNSQNVNTVEEFNKKTKETPVLFPREGYHHNTELLKSATCIVCADVVTQNRIHLPEMARLFWPKNELDNVHPAIFIR